MGETTSSLIWLISSFMTGPSQKNNLISCYLIFYIYLMFHQCKPCLYPFKSPQESPDMLLTSLSTTSYTCQNTLHCTLNIFLLCIYCLHVYTWQTVQKWWLKWIHSIWLCENLQMQQCITSTWIIFLVLEKFGETKYLRMYWPSLTCFVGYIPRNILKIERLHEKSKHQAGSQQTEVTFPQNLTYIN